MTKSKNDCIRPGQEDALIWTIEDLALALFCCTLPVESPWGHEVMFTGTCASKLSSGYQGPGIPCSNGQAGFQGLPRPLSSVHLPGGTWCHHFAHSRLERWPKGISRQWERYNRAMVVRGWTWTLWVGVYTYVQVYSSVGWSQEMEEERKSRLGAGFQMSLHHHILKQKSEKSGSLNSNPDIQVVKKLYLSMSKIRLYFICL